MAAVLHPAVLTAVLTGLVLKFVDFIVATPVWMWGVWFVASGFGLLLASRTLHSAAVRSQD